MKATIKVFGLDGKYTTAKVIYTDCGKHQIRMTTHHKGCKSQHLTFPSFKDAKEYAELMVKSMTESGFDWKLVNVR